MGSFGYDYRTACAIYRVDDGRREAGVCFGIIGLRVAANEYY